MLKIILSVLLFAGILNATETVQYSEPNYLDNFGSNTAKMLAPMSENLLGSTAWSLILSELEFTIDVQTCGLLPGVKAKMIEPIGYAERVVKPLDFPFIGMSLSNNILKSSSIRESGSDDGGQSERSQAAYSHFIYVPLLGIILKKFSAFWCLHKGPITLPYLSEFDPTSKTDFLYVKMVPDILVMLSPDSMLLTVFDCAATSGASALYGFSRTSSIDPGSTSYDTSSASNYLNNSDVLSESSSKESKIDKIAGSGLNAFNTIRNSIYFIDGCNGFSGIGSYQDGDDPVKDAAADWNQLSLTLRGLSAITQTSFLDKQTNISFISPKGSSNKFPLFDSMCSPQEFRMIIASETPLQLAYPIVGKPYEMGEVALTSTTGKMLPGATGVVNVVWQRRDFVAFAYNCPGSGSRKK